MPTLYVVPTPIGNLEDITLRALRVLREVRLIAAEDTRTSRVLLQHYEIDTPMTSYHEHNKLSKLDAIFAALAGGDVALISDAGTPGISDPGYELIQAALAAGIRVEALPGASAAITALVASGLDTTGGFVFLGFPPRKPNELRAFLTEVSAEPRTLILYESPYRLVDTLRLAQEILGDRPACVAREVTKLHEEYTRAPLSEILAYYESHTPRGEVVLLIAGAPPTEPDVWDEARLLAALRDRLEDGERLKDAAKALAAESGWDRKTIYALGIQEKTD
ncbi:MAG: 16S rRNA (cytidine(1402)-2'-O)-methyltransferase [Anaerolineae bacterium]|nr:16S rRNA (cytidine(1402)-2'-O)-methyltransferase [Anaerolineae bacterium]